MTRKLFRGSEGWFEGGKKKGVLRSIMIKKKKIIIIGKIRTEKKRSCVTRASVGWRRKRERKRRIKTGRRCAHLLRVYEAYAEQNERTVTFLFRDREDLPPAIAVS